MAGLAIPAVASSAGAFSVSGYAAVEGRLFLQAPLTAGVRRNSLSLVLRPELFWESDDARHSALFVPFMRLDSADRRRTHFDIRELIYHRFERSWELRLGVGKVFWGVTESRHLVDIINQTDLVENLDGEDKLGQPMVNLTVKTSRGVFDAFVLPGFRERTFPGRRGRLRSEPFVDVDAASYESSAEQRHVDWALRYSHSVGDYDIGLAHFWGTSREPRFVVAPGPRLIPRYDIIHRSSLDLQATKGSMLWKLEAAVESGQGPTYLAWVAGGEYTLYGIMDSRADLGVLAEHLMDGRGSQAPQPFENDLFVGARLALNDMASSEILAGVIQDLGGDGRVFSVEASRRLSDRWTLDMEARIWSAVPARGTLASMRRDDYVQLTLKRYF